MLAAAAVIAAGLWNGVAAQWSQETACPGWNNPTNFINYTGELGDKPLQAYNVMDGTTSMNWSGVILSAMQMQNSAAGSCYDGSSNGDVPDKTKQFAIMTTTSQTPGHPVNRDPNTADHLPYVPTQFNTTTSGPGIYPTTLTRSIRIGDQCANNGNGSGSANNNYDAGANALYYNTYVTTDNALMFIYYACVIQAPGHGKDYDPVFVIQVRKQNASGQWQMISDTLAYYISSTPAPGQGMTISGYGGYGSVTLESNYNINGWHSNGASGSSSKVFYKDWAKVALNLSKYLYQNVRIEIMICDCYGNAHWGYAYVCGECREMTINAQGCPPGMSTDVATLTAPQGMSQYQWSASNMGKSDPVTRLNPGGQDDWFTFRDLTQPLTEAQNGYVYNAQASDFKVNYRPNVPTHDFIQPMDSLGNIVDSFGTRQTFRCRMTSALDPDKPFTSDLYVSVNNTKPTMDIDTMAFCDGNVRLWNRSYVPGEPGLVVDSNTTWWLYNNPGCMGSPIDSLRGDSIDYYFGDTNVHGFIVRSMTTDAECYSDAMYTIKPRTNPKPGMTLTPRTLCDSAESTIRDTTSNSFYREWYFVTSDATTTDSTAPRDTLRGYGTNNRQITRPFSHSTEPIGLMVRNGLYYLNPYNTSDTIWCSAITYDTISVFTHPYLTVTGDTVVCQGSQTHAIVDAPLNPGSTYQWSRDYGVISGGIPAGSLLQVTPYADTSVYYVMVKSPEGCVAWDSIHAYLVRPQLAMSPAEGLICPGDTVTLTGSAADHYTWSASPADPSLNGQQTNGVVYVRPNVTTTYTMVGHGTNDCNASPLSKTVTVRPMPVPKISTTPGYVDPDDPTVVLRDVSTNGVTTLWRFDDGSQFTGREVTHTFDEAVGRDSVYVELVSGNVLNCEVSRRFGIPVILFTAWFPNIFTPGTEDDNAKFRLYSVNEYENFHIYIYDRHGMLVFESDDPDFEWDGTHNGLSCPQGAYVYVCNYRKPMTNTLSSMSGSVTLIR